MKKAAFIIMLLTVFSKVFGFVREIVLSYVYGTSNISDAYLISTTIPVVIFGLIGIGINTGYVPIYTEIFEKEGKKNSDYFTSNLTNILLIISVILILFGLIFTEQLVKLFAIGFKGETLSLTVVFTRITLVGISFILLTYIFSGYLRNYGDFFYPGIIGIPYNILIILMIFLSAKYSLSLLAFGTLIGTISQFLILIPSIKKFKYKHKFIINFTDENIRKMLIIIIPVIIGASVNQLNFLVDRTLASQIVEGGLSALNYANRLNGFIQGIFVLSVTTALYPTISKMAANNNKSGIKKTVSESIILIAVFVIPATIGAMIFSKPIISLLFQRGAFDEKALMMTSNALLYYSIGMFAAGVSDTLSRAFYSIQDTKTPMKVSVFAVVLNIILNIILSKIIGLGGLALATSISSIIGSIILLYLFKNKMGNLGIKNVIIDLIKILFASVLIGIIAKIIFSVLISKLSNNLSLIISVGIASVVYMVIIVNLKIEEINTSLNAIKNKLLRKKNNW